MTGRRSVAKEGAQNAGQSSQQAPGAPPWSGGELPPHRRQRSGLGWKAAVAVLAGGGFGLSHVIGISSASSSVAAGSEAAPAPARPANGTAAARSEAGRPGAVPAFETPARFQVVNSATNYLPATLRQQLETELQRHTQAAAAPQVLVSGSLKGCVLRVTPGTRPGTLVLSERAHFQGQPAIVIVAVSGHDRAAWVTASGCSASTDHVLATATLPGTSAP